MIFHQVPQFSSWKDTKARLPIPVFQKPQKSQFYSFLWFIINLFEAITCKFAKNWHHSVGTLCQTLFRCYSLTIELQYYHFWYLDNIISFFLAEFLSEIDKTSKYIKDHDCAVTEVKCNAVSTQAMNPVHLSQHLWNKLKGLTHENTTDVS